MLLGPRLFIPLREHSPPLSVSFARARRSVVLLLVADLHIVLYLPPMSSLFCVYHMYQNITSVRVSVVLDRSVWYSARFLSSLP